MLFSTLLGTLDIYLIRPNHEANPITAWRQVHLATPKDAIKNNVAAKVEICSTFFFGFNNLLGP